MKTGESFMRGSGIQAVNKTSKLFP